MFISNWGEAFSCMHLCCPHGWLSNFFPEFCNDDSFLVIPAIYTYTIVFSILHYLFLSSYTFIHHTYKYKWICNLLTLLLIWTPPTTAIYTLKTDIFVLLYFVPILPYLEKRHIVEFNSWSINEFRITSPCYLHFVSSSPHT